MLISVLMPVHNSEAFLREALESVLAQSHRDFELIAVDDGSTDGSPAILREVAATDPRIRVITQANAGPASARNTGLRAARGSWVINMDADDVMLPNRIERQLAFIAAHPEVKAFSCRAYYINQRGWVFGQTKCEPITTPEDFLRRLTSNQPIGLSQTGSAMHRETVLDIGGYRSKFDVVGAGGAGEDIDLWNRIAEAGHLVLQQDEILMKYRIHDASTMTAQARKNWEVCEWVVACMRARRLGRPEPTREEFQRQWRTRSLWQRLDQESLMLARIHYRAAGSEIANGRWLRGAGRLALAGLARPTYTFSRLFVQVPLPGRDRTGIPFVARATAVFAAAL